jgi:hypothetical protein
MPVMIGIKVGRASGDVRVEGSGDRRTRVDSGVTLGAEGEEAATVDGSGTILVLSQATRTTNVPRTDARIVLYCMGPGVGPVELQGRMVAGRLPAIGRPTRGPAGP